MNQAFYTGINGTQLHEVSIDTIANNLSNISTPGYRSYSTEFATLFETAINEAALDTPMQNTVGNGGRVQTTTMNTQMGELLLSDSNTDLAIQGNGWFGVMDPSGEALYTRNGSFTFDAERSLVTHDGMRVLGTMGGNIRSGVLTDEMSSVPLKAASAQTALTFPDTLTYPAQPSTVAAFKGNLGIEDETQTMSATVISAELDRLELKLSFVQSEIQPEEGVSWEATAVLRSLDGETVYDTQSGTVTFDETGALTQNGLPALDNGGTPLQVDLGSEYSGLVSQASIPVAASSSSNGLDSGELMGYSIGLDGTVKAAFSNGRSSAVGQIALFHFRNEQGLERLSGTHFMESSNSGEPTFYKDANGNYILGATIHTNKIESSNVRYEVGMTDLIIMQRAFAANAKSISTGDELIQKALQMDA